MKNLTSPLALFLLFSLPVHNKATNSLPEKKLLPQLIGYKRPTSSTIWQTASRAKILSIVYLHEQNREFDQAILSNLKEIRRMDVSLATEINFEEKVIIKRLHEKLNQRTSQLLWYQYENKRSIKRLSRPFDSLASNEDKNYRYFKLVLVNCEKCFSRSPKEIDGLRRAITRLRGNLHGLLVKTLDPFLGADIAQLTTDLLYDWKCGSSGTIIPLGMDTNNHLSDKYNLFNQQL